MKDSYPSLRQCAVFWRTQTCYTCKNVGSFNVVSINRDRNAVKCGKCGSASTMTNVRVLTDVTNFANPDNPVQVNGSKIYYKGDEISAWKASPNPYSPKSPRMALTYADGTKTNLTGSDAALVWSAIEGREYKGGYGDHKEGTLKKSNGDLTFKGIDRTDSPGVGSIRPHNISKKKDPEFEKLKKFVPGTLIRLRNHAAHVDRELQEFLVQKLDKEECAVFLSPVKNGKVADVTAKFTALEISKFNVTVPEQVETLPQEGQIMDRGPYITVQSYYEQWE